VKDILFLDGDTSMAAVYVTLNTINPVLLSRRANRMKILMTRKDTTTVDDDIIRRCWLPVDIDPARPSGVSSSNEEHRAALEKGAAISAYLSGTGWLEPISADSGNGAHLLYRIDLKNDASSRDLVKGVLTILDLIFSDPVCTVDTANFNAARIWKVYGTLARKGDNTPERTHRRA